MNTKDDGSVAPDGFEHPDDHHAFGDDGVEIIESHQSDGGTDPGVGGVVFKGAPANEEKAEDQPAQAGNDVDVTNGDLGGQDDVEYDYSVADLSSVVEPSVVGGYITSAYNTKYTVLSTEGKFHVAINIGLNAVSSLPGQLILGARVRMYLPDNKDTAGEVIQGLFTDKPLPVVKDTHARTNLILGPFTANNWEGIGAIKAAEQMAKGLTTFFGNLVIFEEAIIRILKNDIEAVIIGNPIMNKGMDYNGIIVNLKEDNDIIN